MILCTKCIIFYRWDVNFYEIIKFNAHVFDKREINIILCIYTGTYAAS